jgi:hypothetical protein
MSTHEMILMLWQICIIMFELFLILGGVGIFSIISYWIYNEYREILHNENIL